jgi:hypothetical protein
VRRRLKTLLAAVVAGALLPVVYAAPAHATTWYATCGPKIQVREGMSNIQTIRSGSIGVENVDAIDFALRRGNKAGWGETGIWWARAWPWHYASSMDPGDMVHLNWSDYHPADLASYCEDTSTADEDFALTWGINCVNSSANPWGRRMFSAWAKAYNGATGEWVADFANWNFLEGKTDAYWVVCY